MTPPADVIVYGSGRSGTTWVAQVIAAAGLELVFEPLSWRLDEIRGLGTCRYLGAEDSSRWDDAITRGLSGRIRNELTIRQNAGADRRVIKVIRGNMMIPWIERRFDFLPVFVVRNPLAVVASQYALDWTSNGIGMFRDQPRLVADHLTEHADYLDTLTSRVEQLAAEWCLQNYVPKQQGCLERIPLYRYEELTRDPVAQYERMMGQLGLEFSDAVETQVRQWSFMTRKRTRTRSDPAQAWREILDEDQERAVRAVVDRFGLGEFVAN